MKKIYILTAVFALLTLSLNAQTQTTKKEVRDVLPTTQKAPNRAIVSVTVGDETTYNSYLPARGNYQDYGYRNQMIYTAAQLGLSNGDQITSITFYPYQGTGYWDTNGINFSGSTVTLSLGITTQSSFYNTLNTSDALTVVATITPSVNTSATEWTFTFDTPFTYTSGNLLVDVYCPGYNHDNTTGTYSSSNFFGTTQTSNVSIYQPGSYSASPSGTSGTSSSFLPKATFTYDNSSPKIEASPTTLTINDSGTNNTFTVQGSNLGGDNVGLTQTNSQFDPTLSATTGTYTDGGTYWYFTPADGSVNGTVAMNYEGRDLSASETVTLANSTGASATVTVNYKPDLYIYCDNGVSPWNFTANPAVAMTDQGNGIYTATLDIPANSHILFGRASGLTYGWEGDANRLFIGASTDGGDWGYGANNTGYLDTDPTNDNPVKYHPIYFSESGVYTITIDANAYTFTIDKMVLPPPENVVATADGNNATVTWEEPIVAPVNVTENFDDETKFPPFSIGGITATEHYGAVGGWTLYDSTGSRVWGVDGGSFDHMGEPQAWLVMNPSQATGVSITAHSGDQYMESICPLVNSSYDGGAADHWLISPKLSGNAQTITFYERALSNTWGNELYEVLASSTDNNPESFTSVKTFEDNVLSWTLRSASLPEGTKYFAIRHYSRDIFGVLVDDVTYEAAGEPQPISYNVYLDGVLVGNVDANTFSYDFTNVSVGNHECAISAVYVAGESALVPAQFSTLPKTATPTIEVVTNSDGSKTITAVGDGTVHLYIDGVEQTNPYTIMPSTDGDITVTVTATAQEEGKLISETATETVTVPEAGRSPMPTINMVDNGDGTYTITITGTGDLAVYINDAEHGGTAGDPVATGSQTVSFNVEQHSQTMTITIQATNQEEGLAVSRTAEATYTIPAMSLDGFTPLDPQPANSSTPIDLSNLMFVDRFSIVIPATNDHPFLYDYYLQETQVRQRTSNSVEVPVKHTGSDGLGFYTLSQLDNDVNIGLNHDQGLKMNVRNAAMDLPLEADPGIYFYTESRGTAAYPNQADRKWLAVLQHTTDGTYSETLNPSYDYGEVYPGGQHHIHYDTDTITGDYNNYLAYVPIVWTMGFDRVNYESDHTHNSYGAPRWKTGVAEVNIQSVNAERQIGNQGSTNWTEGETACSMYMIDEITAIGKMPSVNTMPYEPYMFRVFVESKNSKLRGYKKVGDGSEINDATHYEGDGNGPQTGPICVWSEYVNGSDNIGVNGYEYTFSRGKVSEVDSLNHWIVPDNKNIMFAAEDNLLTETNQLGETVIQKDELNIFVRFYYIVEGSADEYEIPASGPYVAQRNRDGAGDAPAGYGSESPGTSPSPSTGVNEISFVLGDIVSQKYYNVQGMESDTPFEGINIVVTRYSSGITRTTKKVVVR